MHTHTAIDFRDGDTENGLLLCCSLTVPTINLLKWPVKITRFDWRFNFHFANKQIENGKCARARWNDREEERERERAVNIERPTPNRVPSFTTRSCQTKIKANQSQATVKNPNRKCAIPNCNRPNTREMCAWRTTRATQTAKWILYKYPPRFWRR